MNDHRESNVTDSFRHILADPRPTAFISVHSIYAAMILLVQNVRCRRVQSHTMWVVSVFGIRIGQKVCDTAGIERMPIGSTVGALEYPAARHPEVHMVRVARVDIDRMHFGSIRCAVLSASGPGEPHGMIVKTRYRFPCISRIQRTEKSLRRSTGVPDFRFAWVPGRQPEDMIDNQSLLSFRCFGECRRFGRLFPIFAEIGRTKYCGTQMTGLGGHQHGAAISRVEKDMMRYMAKENRPSD